MDAHSFCRELLAATKKDLKLAPKEFSATKSTLGGYEIQGPDKFYYYASSACCVWSAKAEAMEHYANR